MSLGGNIMEILESTPYLIHTETGNKYALQKKIKNTIGRQNIDVGGYIQVTDPFVSRIHCAIYFKNGYYIMDKGAKNPVRLNQIFLSEKAPLPLNHGDALQIGSTNFMFILEKKEGIKDFSYTFNDKESLVSIKVNLNTYVMYQESLLEANEIQNIVDFNGFSMCDERVLYYKKGDYKPLMEGTILEGMTFKGKLDFLTQMIKTMVEAKGYMLNENCFILNPKLVFINVHSQFPELIYLPIRNYEAYKKDFSELIRVLFYKENEVTFKNKLLEKINHETFDLLDFQASLVDQWDERVKETMIPLPVMIEPMEERAIFTRKKINMGLALKNKYSKIILFQLFFLVFLGVVIGMKWLNVTEFIGFIILFLALDFWSMKVLKWI